ncbi:MAG: putative deoxyribonuclease YjjV [Bacteroidetes bacterium ADurb.Bin408]|nr:MAG: putative deoxyribonuclease YjjV [Bacteroidetes bacterium ADurb.Bin408]
MILADTHTHLYLEQFDNDRQETVKRAMEGGVNYMLLPNIDENTIGPMLSLAESYPGHIYPMAGLHPTSVKASYKNQLDIIEKELQKGIYCAIGETGIDLYWDKTYATEQKEALRQQIYMAHAYKLPLVLHSRNALHEIISLLKDKSLPRTTGVFHCYPGSVEDAKKITDMGYLLGVGGTVTYKNCQLADVVKYMGLSSIVLETDAPFLPPVPHRGKRNESLYVQHVAQKVSDILNVPVSEVAQHTTDNAIRLFGLT